LLEIRPDPISLGVIEAGTPGKAALTLRNPGSVPLTLERVETSCSCIRVETVPVRIDACGSVDLAVVFDPTSEPDFRGGLSVDLTGRMPGGATLFHTQVNLLVRGYATPTSSALPAEEARP